MNSIKLEFVIQNENQILDVKEKLIQNLDFFQFEQDKKNLIEIAFEEMCINGIIHGNKNNKNKNLFIQIEISHQEFKAFIQDEGDGFSPSVVPETLDFDLLIDLIEKNETEIFTHGRGIYLTRQYMDQVVYNEKGNSVLIVKKK
ncbi:MAG: hypothetical protein A2Y41_12670 [Spirochaetes bacterium GWB1_36_13]|nr:MAG: hypothetical protein A2Y41_12670 [Spirochaetes bacterium GWB1_36_13]